MKKIISKLLKIFGPSAPKKQYTPQQLNLIKGANNFIKKVKTTTRGYDLVADWVKALRNNNLTLKDIGLTASHRLKSAYVCASGEYPLYRSNESANLDFQCIINTYPTVFGVKP